MATIWDAALRDLEQKIRGDTFELWFDDIRHLETSVDETGDRQQVSLEVDDEFTRAWIEENYLDLIEESIAAAGGRPPGDIDVQVFVEGQQRETESNSDSGSSADSASQRNGHADSSSLNEDSGPVESLDIQDGSKAARVGRLDDLEGDELDDPVQDDWVDAPQTDLSEEEREALESTSTTDAERKQEAGRRAVVEAGLNPRYTFDEFVVGSSNQFVHAACLAVANRPAESYNPLFIFGGVGLGKTHLLQAVGNRILREDPETSVVTLSSEDFMNKVITSIRQERMNEFREQFRNECDVLLIDDIQSIAGKDATQQEFFHTFNALYNSGNQIIITSDQPPAELPGIEERLASRFSWGLCADIQPPEFETRIAILEQKAEAEGIELDEDVAHLVARQIRSNVRELEGTLVRLSAQADLMDQAITLEMARDMLGRMNLDADQAIGVDAIIKRVASFFDIKPSDIKGSRRTRAISRPRQYAMFLARKHTDHSYPELGRRFGGKDHTTVLAACQKYEELIEEDEEVAELLDELERHAIG